MHVFPSKHRTASSSTRVLPVFLLVGITETLARYLRIKYGHQRPHIDVRCCWRPLAEAVLAGHLIYVRPAVDNKPPLFELLNVAVAATGNYLLVFLILVGLANALTAILLWRVCVQRGIPRIGEIAGLLFIATVPIAGGTVINVRSFAVAGILLSLSVLNPWGRGAAVAAAGLFSQHAVFAIPVLAYDRVRELTREAAVRWLTAFTLAGLGVVAVAFSVIYAIWGRSSFYGALYWTFGAAVKYTSNPVVPSLIGDTQEWILALYYQTTKLFHLIVPATLVSLLVVAERRSRQTVREMDMLVTTALLLTGSMMIPLLVRAYRAYWLYPLPFLAFMAAVGYHRMLTDNK